MRGLIVCCVAIVLLPADPSVAQADPCAGGASGSLYNAGCDGDSVPVEVAASGIPCDWTPASYAEDGSRFPGIADDLIALPGGGLGQLINDVTFIGWWRSCDGERSFHWIPNDVSATDVITIAGSRAEDEIPAPVFDINPPPSAAGIVNLGMWLAVEAATPPTVRAEAGPHWAEVTPHLATTTWDLGNGDTVTCDGPGVPIIDLETVEQGPCGYTYRQATPGDDTFSVAVTATWQLDYRSSGGNGSLTPISRSATVDYDVDEIQTIGVQG